MTESGEEDGEIVRVLARITKSSGEAKRGYAYQELIVSIV